MPTDGGIPPGRAAGIGKETGAWNLGSSSSSCIVLVLKPTHHHYGPAACQQTCKEVTRRYKRAFKGAMSISVSPSMKAAHDFYETHGWQPDRLAHTHQKNATAVARKKQCAA